MKPGFALNLSHDGIGLLHRTPRGWMPVGEVSLDDPALGETLGFLRKTALGLEPQGLTTKLIVPNSQILYADVEAPGPDAATRRRQIRAALDGMTPYTVDELVFDWTPLEDGRVRVAVVARDTLQEAEEFAADHRMAPVSFVAMPDEGQFAGEPFFGATRLSNSLLPPGERVERDAEPVRLIGGATPKPAAEAPKPAEPAIEDEAEAEAEGEVVAAATDAEAASQPEAEPAAEAEVAGDDAAEALRPGAAMAEPEVAEQAVAEAEVAEAETPKAEVTEPEVAEPAELPEADLPETESVALSADAPDSAAEADEADAEVASPEPAAAFAAEPSEPSVAPTDAAEAKEVADLAPDTTVADGAVTAEPAEPPASEAPVEAERPAAVQDTEPAVPAASDEAVAEEEPELARAVASAVPAFASRRVASDGGAPPMPTGGPRLSAVPSRISLPGAPARPGELPSLRAEAKPGRELAVPLRGKGGTRKSAPRPAPPPVRARVEITPQTPVEPAKPGLGLGADVLAPAAAEVRPQVARAEEAAPAPAAPASRAARTAAETTGATAGSGVFGSRSARPVRGKPRHLGLILTLVLLLLLGLVAVWSSLFLGPPEQADGGPGTEVVPPAPVQMGQAVEQDAAPLMPSPEELLLAEDAPFVTDPGEEIPGELAATEAEAVEAVEPEAAPQAALTEDLPPPGAADLSPDAAVTATPGGNGEVALQRPDQLAAAITEQAAVPRSLPLLPSLNPAEADQPPLAQVDPAPAEALLTALAAAEAAAAARAAEAESADVGADAVPDAEIAAAPPAAPEATAAEPEEVFEIAVIEGRPAAVPPPNPFAEAAEPDVAPPSLDVTGAVLEALAAEVPVEGSVSLLEDPSLAGVRPRARPAAIEDAAAPEAEDQGAVESATDDAEAAPTALAEVLRPRARPESASNASLVQIAPEAEPEAPAEIDASASAMAIAASIRPAAKPSNFNAAVEQALTAALAAAPAPQPQQQAAAAPSPRDAVPEVEEDNEPEIAATAVPNIPTRANVAAAATVTRGINLREMNLIGVAGTANNRRALVRMSNGRVVQVRVGDRLDGGQVAAIGERQLSYVKGGRTHRLDIPQG